MRARLPQLAGLALVAGALLVGLVVVADGIRDRGAVDTVTVTGSAKRSVTADYVVWDASISAQAPGTEAAAARLNEWVPRLLALLRESGIRDDEVSVAPISTETLFSNPEAAGSSTLAGYRLTRSVQVRSARIDVVVRAIEESSSLLGRGIPLAAAPPQFTYTKLEALRPVLSAEATKDAVRRAQAVVEVTGSELGAIREVNVAPFQVTAPGSTDIADYGIYDTSTREKEVTAVVNVSFAVT